MFLEGGYVVQVASCNWNPSTQITLQFQYLKANLSAFICIMRACDYSQYGRLLFGLSLEYGNTASDAMQNSSVYMATFQPLPRIVLTDKRVTTCNPDLISCVNVSGSYSIISKSI